ncbi:hypothetical protein JW911_05110 [Candidatus Peregrinibacteria bacterium]|nr:hypothetical protein [Candidatus Peregrinibacteria bacterium]
MSQLSKKRQPRESFYFDDCPICQAMKTAEKEERNPNIEELIRAFKKAKTDYKG